ncbi:hypothetical protein K493DRAFT_360515 [Basidiobolus meristosporus CBS 931.73]|uniref:Transmembrane 9 superfamily member n=1 Tax=Basidiobolus meristosporus CBS 931.73 TaxID=1314790 RepID=A0A1Y1XBV2_9FUNG|nr:hypothetical protein K493DRAFT_411750 [Basidiobolus meristosporus CBS 931.73]ORX85148.1 hypothetical protein K493DRAFT_360515 [Basidiobolus meristosporus CBS 931.73]|eukprot:ORX82844.1 hypothetical protein K493DRAFT_411750 [Basidiobolus meristosporus CBS 931.73]
MAFGFRLPTLLVYLLTLLPYISYAFHVPGFTPNVYKENDNIPLYVNKVFSDKTQLPHAYHDLPFVCPNPDAKRSMLNLGEILSGDRIYNSEYKLHFGENTECNRLCTLQITAEDAKTAQEMIRDDYRVEWIVDDLPSAAPYHTVENTKKMYEAGFHLGQVDPKTSKTYLNNHVLINILYETKEADPTARLIVGFEVYPYSIESAAQCPNIKLNNDQAVPKKEISSQDTSIDFTYTVVWTKENVITWGTRWSLYMANNDPQIHWYSIINSMVIILFLTSMVAVIMLRTLNRDISLYNDEDFRFEEAQEDTIGWKLVHGDVFRAPKYGGLFAPLVGTGVQLFMMFFATIFFGLVGILNPSYRGGLVSFALFLFVFMGMFGGYFSARLYKVFKGNSWKKNAFMTGFVVPGFIFGIICVLNIFVWAQHSSTAIPFGTFFALVSMWFCISMPLIFVGSFFGFKKQVIQHPVRTNQIPRQIPEQVWYMQPIPSVLVGGLMPFAVIVIELVFILKSIWQDQFYYMFGFLSLVFVILVITCIEITIVITYFQLCGENYLWWWRSFFVGGSSGLYIFLYSLMYCFAHLHITHFVSFLVFVTYSFVACVIYALVTGSVSFLVTYFFVRKIFRAVKLD